jgi:hypothetical protein
MERQVRSGRVPRQAYPGWIRYESYKEVDIDHELANLTAATRHYRNGKCVVIDFPGRHLRVGVKVMRKAISTTITSV